VAISSKVQDFMSRASWIRRMFEEGNDLKARFGAENVFDFSLGNPVMEPPMELVDTLRRLTADPEVGIHRYMPNAGYPAVRAKVAAALAAEAGVPVEARHLVMTVGAACGLNITLKALLDPGDEVLILAPYFVEYVFYADNHGGVAKVVETDADFLPDPAAIDAAIGPRTKVLILNSPNNPTGVVYPRSLLEELATTLEQAEARVGHPIYVISDEPYRKISYGDEVVPSLSVFRNSILCTSHSKDLALAGERIGVAAVHPEAADSDELVAAMTFAIRTLGFVNAPALMQLAVADLQHVTVDVGEYRRNRDLLLGGLRDVGLECNEPGGAFYLFPRCPVEDDVAFIRRLQKQRLLAVPGSGFGRGGYFRLSYCVDREMIERALPALRRAMEDS
jgi:aspartate aminotransferase